MTVVGVVWTAHPVILAELGVQLQVKVVPDTSDRRVNPVDCPEHIDLIKGEFVRCGVGFTHIVYWLPIPEQLLVDGVIIYNTLPVVLRRFDSCCAMTGPVPFSKPVTEPVPMVAVQEKLVPEQLAERGMFVISSEQIVSHIG